MSNVTLGYGHRDFIITITAAVTVQSRMHVWVSLCVFRPCQNVLPNFNLTKLNNFFLDAARHWSLVFYPFSSKKTNGKNKATGNLGGGGGRRAGGAAQMVPAGREAADGRNDPAEREAAAGRNEPAGREAAAGGKSQSERVVATAEADLGGAAGGGALAGAAGLTTGGGAGWGGGGGRLGVLLRLGGDVSGVLKRMATEVRWKDGTIRHRREVVVDDDLGMEWDNHRCPRLPR